MEMNVKKVGKSKFGYYLMDENQKFTGTTEEVKNQLENQVPCKIEVNEFDDKTNAIKVSILSATKVEKPEKVEEIKPSELGKETNEGNYYAKQNNVQNSIKAQFSIREGLRMIELHNAISDEKMKPTMNNVLDSAKIVMSMIEELVK